MNILDNGIGGLTGSILATAKPLHTTFNIWYVSSVSGNAGYNGRDRKMPLPTLAQAVGLASAGDFIVLLSDHDETISTAVAVNRTVTIIGEGSVSGKPTATLTQGDATANVLTVTATQCIIDNILFKPHSSAASGSFIDCTIDKMVIRSCYFEMNENCDGPGVHLDTGSADCRMELCTFESTAQTIGDLPDSAVRVSATITNLVLDNCVFDGGLYGFETSSNEPWAFDGTPGTQTFYKVYGLTLKNGTDFKLGDCSTGFIAMSSATQDGRIIYNAPCPPPS